MTEQSVLVKGLRFLPLFVSRPEPVIVCSTSSLHWTTHNVECMPGDEAKPPFGTTCEPYAAIALITDPAAALVAANTWPSDAC